jgi:hypothetical protein
MIFTVLQIWKYPNQIRIVFKLQRNHKTENEKKEKKQKKKQGQQPVVDKDNHLSKPIFYLSVLQMKRSSTCLITAFLWEGPFFYFYVESPPSTFMHHLREHSCHSEFNVHSPKVYH